MDVSYYNGFREGILFNIQGLENELEKLNNSKEAMSQDDFERAYADINRNLEAERSRLTNVEKTIEQLSKSVVQPEPQFEPLSVQQPVVDEENSLSLEKCLKQKTSIENDIKSLESKIRELNARNDGSVPVREAIENYTRAINVGKEKLDNVNALISKLEGKNDTEIEEINSIEQLNTAIESCKGEITKLTAELDKLNMNKDKLELSQYDKIKADIESKLEIENNKLNRYKMLDEKIKSIYRAMFELKELYNNQPSDEKAREEWQKQINDKVEEIKGYKEGLPVAIVNSIDEEFKKSNDDKKEEIQLAIPDNKDLGNNPDVIKPLSDGDKEKKPLALPSGKEHKIDEPIEVDSTKKWSTKKKILIALGLTALAVGTIVALQNLIPAIAAATMSSNAALWHTATVAQQATLHNANISIAQTLSSFIGKSAVFDGITGIWTIGGVELSAYAATAITAAKTAVAGSQFLTLGGLTSLGAGLLLGNKEKEVSEVYTYYNNKYRLMNEHYLDEGADIILSEDIMDVIDTINSDNNLSFVERKKLLVKYNILLKKVNKQLKKMEKAQNVEEDEAIDVVQEENNTNEPIPLGPSQENKGNVNNFSEEFMNLYYAIGRLANSINSDGPNQSHSQEFLRILTEIKESKTLSKNEENYLIKQLEFVKKQFDVQVQSQSGGMRR